MQTRHLIILVVAAAIAVLAAVWTGSLREGEHPAGDAAGALLLPGLEAALNDVSGISIKSKDDKAVTLERTADAWIIREKSGYPAETGKIRKFLIGLAQAKLVEPKTSNAERYGELGVADLDAPAPADGESDAADDADSDGSTGVLVSVNVPMGDADEVEMLIGSSARGATGTYVRKPGDAQSWLASGDLSVDADPLNWLDRQILNVAANRIQQVTIRHPDGETLVVSKDTPETTNYVVHDVPDKEEIKYDSVGNPLASVLSSLRLDDVHMLAAKDPGPHSPIEAEYRTFDGLVVKAQAYADGDQRLVHFTASFDEEQARRFHVAPAAAEGDDAADGDGDGDDAAADDAAADADPDAADDTAADQAAGDTAADDDAADAAEPAAAAEPDFSTVRKEAEMLNTKVQPWVYAIASYKYDQIDKRMADMLKVEEKEAAAN
jgi:hypothetical protein